jgi:hypothetical protein
MCVGRFRRGERRPFPILFLCVPVSDPAKACSEPAIERRGAQALQLLNHLSAPESHDATQYTRASHDPAFNTAKSLVPRLAPVPAQIPRQWSISRLRCVPVARNRGSSERSFRTCGRAHGCSCVPLRRPEQMRRAMKICKLNARTAHTRHRPARFFDGARPRFQ